MVSFDNLDEWARLMANQRQNMATERHSFAATNAKSRDDMLKQAANFANEQMVKTAKLHASMLRQQGDENGLVKYGDAAPLDDE